MISLMLLFLAFFAQIPQDTAPNQDIPRLKEGEKAPLFKIEDVYGKQFKLKKILKSNEKTLLVFMRHAWCPVCNLRSHELIDNYKNLQAAGYEVVVVYESKQEALLRYVEDHQLPFKVIADPQGLLYKEYKVERNAEKLKASLKRKETLEHIEKGKNMYKKEFKSYMAEGESVDALIPADFVLDHKGKIIKAYYGQYLDDHLPLEELVQTTLQDTNSH
ncbi:redoxin domain-containing protein [Saprospira sp. CCB-QB6]|uniref:peroxiredoxin family protein n=1 Tax=Saprospira sp. CCB-QB6 TaxID=3023936 RepID=UPI00234A1F34|nr:redoxin domain-containing protein [Saprospira sp. CCB-QB6]WCL80942.1 redoxin domain-containing protein [Saprospira sp. CCB-QB6]